jgi:predicted AAA+ superfamily ATPase
MIINRKITHKLKQKLQKGKVLVLYGARRTGKTFSLGLLKEELEKTEKVLVLNGESRIVQDNLSTEVPEQLARYVGDAATVIIDEAQKIPNIGLNLKILVDTLPQVKIIASGSASFDLAQKVGEPLTGRKKTLTLYPVSVSEIIDTKGEPFYRSTFEDHLIYGGYPELFSISSAHERQSYLGEIVDAYLFKDILELDRIKNAKKLRDLLTLIAFQIGKEVSLPELGNSLDLHKDTVARYLDILEKAFVLINIRGFSRNLRKEVSKSSRYYFYDNGIRNALINNFNPPNLRDDVGMLWENYIVMERLKKQSYEEILSNNYFWRTYDKKELDFLEERGGVLYGYEIKWGNKKTTAPKGWLETYKNAKFELINRENFLDFIV